MPLYSKQFSPQPIAFFSFDEESKEWELTRPSLHMWDGWDKHPINMVSLSHDATIVGFTYRPYYPPQGYNYYSYYVYRYVEQEAVSCPDNADRVQRKVKIKDPVNDYGLYYYTNGVSWFLIDVDNKSPGIKWIASQIGSLNGELCLPKDHCYELHFCNNEGSYNSRMRGAESTITFIVGRTEVENNAGFGYNCTNSKFGTCA